MFLALYVFTVVALFLPFSLLLRLILNKLGVDSVLQEIRELTEKASKMSPKDKKMRMVRGRYEVLKRKLRSVFLINLFIMWTSIFVAITASNLALVTISNSYGVTITFRSPVKLPFLVLGDEQLNIFLVILAVILAYQPLHNRLSTMERVYEA